MGVETLPTYGAESLHVRSRDGKRSTDNAGLLDDDPGTIVVERAWEAEHTDE